MTRYEGGHGSQTLSHLFFNSLTQLGEAMLVSADCIRSLRSVSKHYNVQFYAVPPFK